MKIDIPLYSLFANIYLNSFCLGRGWFVPQDASVHSKAENRYSIRWLNDQPQSSLLIINILLCKQPIRSKLFIKNANILDIMWSVVQVLFICRRKINTWLQNAIITHIRRIQAWSTKINWFGKNKNFVTIPSLQLIKGHVLFNSMKYFIFLPPKGFQNTRKYQELSLYPCFDALAMLQSIRTGLLLLIVLLKDIHCHKVHNPTLFQQNKCLWNCENIVHYLFPKLHSTVHQQALYLNIKIWHIIIS